MALLERVPAGERQLDPAGGGRGGDDQGEQGERALNISRDHRTCRYIHPSCSDIQYTVVTRAKQKLLINTIQVNKQVSPRPIREFSGPHTTNLIIPVGIYANLNFFVSCCNFLFL